MRARRKDANQASIERAFRKMGCSVFDTSALGRGFPDLVVGHGGICIGVEIKDGSKPPSARKLTPAQQEFRDNWTGGMRIVESVDDAIATVYLLRKWHSAICTIGDKK